MYTKHLQLISNCAIYPSFKGAEALYVYNRSVQLKSIGGCMQVAKVDRILIATVKLNLSAEMKWWKKWWNRTSLYLELRKSRFPFLRKSSTSSRGTTGSPSFPERLCKAQHAYYQDDHSIHPCLYSTIVSIFKKLTRWRGSIAHWRPQGKKITKTKPSENAKLVYKWSNQTSWHCKDNKNSTTYLTQSRQRFIQYIKNQTSRAPHTLVELLSNISNYFFGE